MERHYSPGRTWQSLAVGFRRAAPPGRRARRRLGRRRGGHLPLSLLPLSHLHRYQRAHDRGRARAVRQAPQHPRSGRRRPRSPLQRRLVRLGRRVSHADVRHAPEAGPRRVRPRAPPRRPARPPVARRAPATRGHSRLRRAPPRLLHPRAPRPALPRQARHRHLRRRLPRDQEAPLSSDPGHRRQTRAIAPTKKAKAG